jgi:hypothetical protein
LYEVELINSYNHADLHSSNHAYFVVPLTDKSPAITD